MKTITSFSTLMYYAGKLGEARRSGDAEAIAEAEREHDWYRDLCLRADEMIVELPKERGYP